MKILTTYFRNEMLTAFVWVLLFIWAMTATIYASKKKDQIIFVKMQNENLSLITDLNTQDENYLERIFLKRFTQLHYTYDNQNFEQNLENSARFLDDTIWSDIKDKINKQKNFIENKNVSQTAVVEKIIKKDYLYEVILNVISQKSTITLDRKFKITLELKPTKRTVENPFGIYITKLVEEELVI